MIIPTQVIYNLYPNVVRTVGDKAFDENSNEVEYDKAAIQSYIDANEYKAKRAAEYPPMADYLDAIVKGDAQQQAAYIAACLAVKAKYPK